MPDKKPRKTGVDLKGALTLLAVVVLSVWLQRKMAEPDFFETCVRRGKALIPPAPLPPEPPHAWIRELYDGTR